MALVLLDAGLVGLLISEANGRNAARDSEGEAFRAWYAVTAGTIHEFALTDLTLYEVLRGLLVKGAAAKSRRLDAVRVGMVGIAIDPSTWERAAQLWARVRLRGEPTAAPDSLDGDAILAAVAVLLAEAGESVIVATTNLRHLVALGADARSWRDIPNRPERPPRADRAGRPRHRDEAGQAPLPLRHHAPEGGGILNGFSEQVHPLFFLNRINRVHPP